MVGHGFTNHVRRPVVRRMLDRLARHCAVLALDFRGQGRSAGISTVGADETLDIDAAVGHARALGYARVATLGVSLGAAVVLRHAALHEDHPNRPDAVVAVSTMARWWVRDTVASRRAHWMVEQPHGRLLGRLLNVRLGQPWVQPPVSPIELVHLIAPVPLLLVHGEQDQYFPVEHAIALHQAYGGGAQLWLEQGMRHAETALTPELVDRMARWVLRSAGPVDAAG